MQTRHQTHSLLHARIHFYIHTYIQYICMYVCIYIFTSISKMLLTKMYISKASEMFCLKLMWILWYFRTKLGYGWMDGWMDVSAHLSGVGSVRLYVWLHLFYVWTVKFYVKEIIEMSRLASLRVSSKGSSDTTPIILRFSRVFLCRKYTKDFFYFKDSWKPHFRWIASGSDFKSMPITFLYYWYIPYF